MKQTKSKITLENILLIIFFLQFLGLIYLNLFVTKFGFDTITPYLQAVEIWNQKKIFIDNWQYQTTLNLDSSTPIAALFYGITKNISLSFGITNIIISLLYIYTFNAILKTLNISAISIYLGLILLLTPFKSGELGYYCILFFSNSYYGIKALIPLIFIYISIHFYTKNTLKGTYGTTSLLLFFIAISSVSTGTYIFISIITPIILFHIIEYLYTNNNLKIYKSKLIRLDVIIFIISVIGFLCRTILKQAGIEAHSPTGKIVLVDNYFESFGVYLASFFNVFGALPTGDQPGVISPSGIPYIFAYLFTLLVIIATVFAVKLTLKHKKKNYYHLIALVLSFILFNMFIFSVMDSETTAARFPYRYHVYYTIFIFLIVVLFFEILRKKHPHMLTNLYILAFVTLTCLVSLNGYKYYILKEDTPKENSLLEKVFSNYIKTKDIKLISFLTDNYNELKIGRNIKPLHLNTEITTIKYPEMKPYIWGGSTHLTDISTRRNQESYVIIQSKLLDSIPNYIKNNYTQDTIIEDYSILKSNKADILDCFSEFPTIGENEDLPYTYGYDIFDNSISDQGTLKSNLEGIILENKLIKAKKGTYNLSFHYKYLQSGRKESYMEIIKNNKADTVKLNNKDTITSYVLTVTSNAELQLRLFNEANNSIEFKSIKFEKD